MPGFELASPRFWVSGLISVIIVLLTCNLTSKFELLLYKSETKLTVCNLRHMDILLEASFLQLGFRALDRCPDMLTYGRVCVRVIRWVTASASAAGVWSHHISVASGGAGSPTRLYYSARPSSRELTYIRYCIRETLHKTSVVKHTLLGFRYRWKLFTPFILC